MPAKGTLSPRAGQAKHYTQAACILCGGDAKRYGRATGSQYGTRYICGKCMEKGYRFNRAGEIVQAEAKPTIEWAIYEAVVYKLLDYGDCEPFGKDRDTTFEWVKALPHGLLLIDNWYERKPDSPVS